MEEPKGEVILKARHGLLGCWPTLSAILMDDEREALIEVMRYMRELQRKQGVKG